MRVEYEVPPEYRKALAPHLKTWARFAPPWCYLLYVIRGSGEECTLSITASPEYRRATLYVHAPFLGETEKARSEILLHELMHIHTAALRAVALKLVDASVYADDEKLRAGVLDEVRVADEGTVSDLMAVIHATAHRWM